MFLIVTVVVRLLLAPSLGLMFFALLYGSFWVPQIARAARRGRSCALEGRYLVGTTLGRVAIAGCESSLIFSGSDWQVRKGADEPADYLIYPKNVLDVTPRRELLYEFSVVHLG